MLLGWAFFYFHQCGCWAWLLQTNLQGLNRKSVAILADGAMTAGESFEALNNAGAMKDTDLLVILNDNEMSISPNVGALLNISQ